MNEEKQTSAELTEEQKKKYCFQNGMTPERWKKLLNDGCTVDEIYQSAKNILENGGTLTNDNIFKAKKAADFGDDKTEFVWYPYIPIGDYTVLMADGGTGKTILCCGIIANLSKGELLPGEVIENLPSTTLIISAEDRGELLKKRLSASGADLNKVYIVDCMDSEGLNFTDKYNEFIGLIKQHNPKLVIIDPWHAFLGADVDINRVNAVRPVFQSLANIAKTCNCGMILVSHVNKRAQGENANNAATGSTDFINAARSAMRVIFSEEPGEDDVRILIHTKSNYAAAGKSVKYEITSDSGCKWAGFSEITRKTLEEAARRKKTAGEVIDSHHEQAETKLLLIRAIQERAVCGKTVRVSYDELKELYGGDIFGSGQPKKALDSIASNLEQYEISIETGKKVLYKGKSLNGFYIYKEIPIDDMLADLPE